MLSKGFALPKDHETDPWIAAFICELHSFFGTPVAGFACKSKEDKLQYLWSRIGISNALALEEPMWRAMKDRVEPSIAAEEFARRFYGLRRKMIVEETPIFNPSDASIHALQLPAKKEIR
jgi:hypothetical protein